MSTIHCFYQGILFICYPLLLANCWFLEALGAIHCWQLKALGVGALGMGFFAQQHSCYKEKLLLDYSSSRDGFVIQLLMLFPLFFVYICEWRFPRNTFQLQSQQEMLLSPQTLHRDHCSHKKSSEVHYPSLGIKKCDHSVAYSVYFESHLINT